MPGSQFGHKASLWKSEPFGHLSVIVEFVGQSGGYRKKFDLDSNIRTLAQGRSNCCWQADGSPQASVFWVLSANGKASSMGPIGLPGRKTPQGV